MKADRRQASEAAQRPVPVRCVDCMRTIFNQPQYSVSAQLGEVFDTRPNTSIVRGDNCLGSFRYCGCGAININVQAVRIDIDEYRNASIERDRVGRRYKGIGWKDDLITGFNSDEGDCHFQGGRTCMHQDHMFRPHLFLEDFLTSFAEAASRRQKSIVYCRPYIIDFAAENRRAIEGNWVALRVKTEGQWASFPDRSPRTSRHGEDTRSAHQRHHIVPCSNWCAPGAGPMEIGDRLDAAVGNRPLPSIVCRLFQRHGAHGTRRGHERGRLPGLCRADPGAGLATRRNRCAGQSAGHEPPAIRQAIN